MNNKSAKDKGTDIAAMFQIYSGIIFVNVASGGKYPCINIMCKHTKDNYSDCKVEGFLRCFITLYKYSIIDNKFRPFTYIYI